MSKKLADIIDGAAIQKILEAPIPDEQVLPDGCMRKLTEDEIEKRARMQRDIVAAACAFVFEPTLHRHKSLISRVEIYEKEVSVFLKIARKPVPVEELTK